MKKQLLKIQYYKVASLSQVKFNDKYFGFIILTIAKTDPMGIINVILVQKRNFVQHTDISFVLSANTNVCYITHNEATKIIRKLK